MSRSAALERLDVFVGEWTIEPSFALAPSSPAVGRVVFEWALHGQFLTQRAEVPHPDAPDTMAIIGLDPTGEAYLQHYFDSRGVVRVYSMRFADGRWQLLRDSPDFSPLNFCQRFTGTFDEDGRTINGRWETSSDGSHWEPDFELIDKRVVQPPSQP